MTTKKAIEIIRAYAAGFGEAHTEELLAPNYLADERFVSALAVAVATGQPLKPERAAERFGPPFQEGVIGPA